MEKKKKKKQIFEVKRIHKRKQNEKKKKIQVGGDWLVQKKLTDLSDALPNKKFPPVTPSIGNKGRRD